MVDREAVGVLPAGTGTRVGTLVVDARLVLRTLGAHDAAWPAGRRDAGESRLAQAHRVSVGSATVAVGSAWRRVARICRYQRRFHDRATDHRVTGVTR